MNEASLSEQAKLADLPLAEPGAEVVRGGIARPEETTPALRPPPPKLPPDPPPPTSFK